MISRAQHGPTDVAKISHFAIRARLQDNIRELLRLDQPAQGAHRVLEILPFGHRRLPDLPSGHLHVLLAQRRNHITD